MKTRYLTLAAVVTVWAGAAVAAINYGRPEPVDTARTETPAIPRVVVTGKRLEAPIARIVVVGRRIDAGQVVAAQ